MWTHFGPWVRQSKFGNQGGSSEFGTNHFIKLTPSFYGVGGSSSPQDLTFLMLGHLLDECMNEKVDRI